MEPRCISIDNELLASITHKVYVTASRFLWGRTLKIQVVICEYRRRDSDVEYETGTDALRMIEEQYLSEYAREDIELSKFLRNGCSM